ncbi:MAG: 2-hydroxy-3-oxopropionate reductase [Parvibaculaceae bacterium]
MNDVGFIGLGIMGRPMAANLLRAGNKLVLHSRSGVPDDLKALGGASASSPAAVAAGADVVITMLPDTPDVEAVLFGPDGVAAALRPGAIVMDMSSISPIATREFAHRVVEKGGAYVDAPVSGGEIGAREATLTIMVGGKEESCRSIWPLLEAMGRSVTRIGDVGAGQTAKVANQIVVALTLQAVSEGLTFAARSGVDPAVVREALLGGFAGSRVLDVHGRRMIERTFTPGFRIKLHRKDLDLALSTARSLNQSLPATALVQQLFAACAGNGLGDADHSALVRATELLGGS